ncbi:protein of unknown function [Candidatus Methylomirabilis oxygeniifera]|uniref:Uncharacterized protein n=1 Tax=Methylomirabilis oxygeniifera TaxID=671143 RepID=D5MHB7_METO1|nr:protein of unknown function [Candidatus Methylomirabilis oxyfera]
MGVPFDVDLLGHRHTLEVFVQDPTGLGSPPSEIDRDLMIHGKLKQLVERWKTIGLDVLPKLRLDQNRRIERQYNADVDARLLRALRHEERHRRPRGVIVPMGCRNQQSRHRPLPPSP